MLQRYEPSTACKNVNNPASAGGKTKTAVKTDVGQQTAARPFLLAITPSNITQQTSSPHGLGDKSKRPCNVNLLAPGIPAAAQCNECSCQ
jgi:hypothetical protein